LDRETIIPEPLFPLAPEFPQGELRWVSTCPQSGSGSTLEEHTIECQAQQTGEL